MNIADNSEYDEVMDMILESQEAQSDIRRKIRELENMLNEELLNEYLLKRKLESPLLIQSDLNMGKYKYITKPIYIKNLKMYLYPVWLNLECTYPIWSDDIMAINIVRYENRVGKGLEILLEGLKKSLGLSYDECKKLINKGKIEIPLTIITNCRIGSDIKIDFNKGEHISYYEFKKRSYYLLCTDDNEMKINTVKIKYILLLPSNCMSEIV